MASRIRLLIIDDHPLVREGVPKLLEHYPDLETVGTASGYSEGISKLATLHPDVLVLDLAMPGIGGLESIGQYLRTSAKLRIVIFSGNTSEAAVSQAVRDGALGFVTKGSSISQLVEAIRHAHRGEYWFSDHIRSSCIEGLLKSIKRGRTDETGLSSLSPRERQAFSLFSLGKSTMEIAETLCISPKTVGKHRVAIKRKLKLRSTAEMVLYATSQGKFEAATGESGSALSSRARTDD